MDSFYAALLVLIVWSAVMTDLIQGIIPNPLLAAGFLIAIGRALTQKGDLPGLAAGALLPLLVLLPLFRLRMFGAGDLKLLAVTGSFLGPEGSMRCLLDALWLAGALSLVQLLDLQNAGERFSCLFSYLKDASRRIRAGEAPAPYLDRVTDDGKLCFSVPVWLALMLELARK